MPCMPGKSIKNWRIYHALRKRRGMSKTRAAKIANAKARKANRRPR